MSNKIPNKYIRKAYITAIGDIGVPFYEMKVPKDADIPDQYVIVSTQNTNQQDTSKCGHNWRHSILLDIVSQNLQGYSKKVTAEDIAQQINAAIMSNGDIDCDPFTIYDTQMVDMHDMSLDTPEKSISRLLVRYQHKMWEKSAVPQP